MNLGPVHDDWLASNIPDHGLGIRPKVVPPENFITESGSYSYSWFPKHLKGMHYAAICFAGLTMFGWWDLFLNGTWLEMGKWVGFQLLIFTPLGIGIGINAGFPKWANSPLSGEKPPLFDDRERKPMLTPQQLLDRLPIRNASDAALKAAIQMKLDYRSQHAPGSPDKPTRPLPDKGNKL